MKVLFANEVRAQFPLSPVEEPLNVPAQNELGINDLHQQVIKEDDENAKDLEPDEFFFHNEVASVDEEEFEDNTFGIDFEKNEGHEKIVDDEANKLRTL